MEDVKQDIPMILELNAYRFLFNVNTIYIFNSHEKHINVDLVTWILNDCHSVCIEFLLLFEARPQSKYGLASWITHNIISMKPFFF